MKKQLKMNAVDKQYSDVNPGCSCEVCTCETCTCGQ